MKKIQLTTCLLFAPIAYLAGNLAHSQESFPLTILNIGRTVITAEVASTPAQREQGLTHREKLDKNAGMVSVLEQPQPICMLTKNVPIPLAVAFLEKDGKIINIEEMKAQAPDKRCAKKPASYVLAMNGGWFKQNNIKPGDKVENLPGSH